MIEWTVDEMGGRGIQIPNFLVGRENDEKLYRHEEHDGILILIFGRF